jgi:hypothetical protein
VLALLFLPVRVFLNAHYRQKPLRVEVEYRALGLVKGRFAFDERRLGPYRERIGEFDYRTLLTAAGRRKIRESLARLGEMPELLRVRAGPEYSRDVFYAVLRSTYIEKFRVLASIGSTDAARTGYLAGIAWAIAGIVQWASKEFLPVAGTEPQFAIRPDFNSTTIEASVEATLKGRIAPVLVALLRSRFMRHVASRHNRRYAKAN